jgi:hypothetical protein
VVIKETKVFTVQVTGVGQPDYAQPQPVVGTEKLLVVSYPETEVSANKYDDYSEFDLTSSIIEYVVGANANAQKSGSWPSGVLAKNIAFYSEVDFYLRYNYSDAIEHEIPFKILKTSDRRTERIFIRAKGALGKLKVWIEG